MQVLLKKSVTLAELIIGTILFGVIVLGAGTFHAVSDQFLRSSEEKGQLLNELTFVLRHLHSNILLGAGDNTNSANIGINIPAADTLTIRQDMTATGIPLDTPSDYSDDRIARYEFGTGGNPNSIRFRVNADSWEVLSQRFVNLGFSISRSVADGGVVIDNLAFRLDPTSASDPNSNPQVTTIDTGGNRTVYFYSLSHSWQ
ncbi:MAG: hypothetical protein ABIE75_01940 [Candidatus Omnitrophota bacterium]